MIQVSISTLSQLFDYYVHKTIGREDALPSILLFKRQEVYTLRKGKHYISQYKIIITDAQLEKKVWHTYIRSETSTGKTTGDVARDLNVTLASVNQYLI